MDAAAELGRNPVSKHQIQPEYGDELADAGRDCQTRLARPNSQARTRTSRMGNHTRLIHTLAICVTIHDRRGECGFHAVHTAISWWVCFEVPSNRCGHLLSKMGISYQAPTVDWWLSWGPPSAVSRKIANEHDGGGYNVMVRNEKEGRAAGDAP